MSCPSARTWPFVQPEGLTVWNVLYKILLNGTNQAFSRNAGISLGSG
jgi:hypothetical protein